MSYIPAFNRRYSDIRNRSNVSMLQCTWIHVDLCVSMGARHVQGIWLTLVFSQGRMTAN